MRTVFLIAPIILAACATGGGTGDAGDRAEPPAGGGLICCALARQDFLATIGQCELAGGFQQPMRNCRSG